HGGTLSIHSKEGEGSTFTLSFPAYAGAQPATAADTCSLLVRPLTLLAVDDNARLLGVITALLQSDGHKVYGALSASDALSLASAQRFDAAFVDLVMPEMGGDQLIARLRELGHAMPVVVVTGTAGHLAPEE